MISFATIEINENQGQLIHIVMGAQLSSLVGF